MITVPRYPHFREITIQDKPIFQDVFAQSPPQISEYTYTNLFIWNYYYHFLWCLWDECICIMARPEREEPFLLPPIGTYNLAERTINLLSHLQSMEARPAVRRVPDQLVTEHLAGHDHLVITQPDRDNSDFGELVIKLHHQINTTIPAKVLILGDMEHWNKAWLRPLKRTELAKTGDVTKYQMIAELTLESRQEAGHGKIAGLKTA